VKGAGVTFAVTTGSATLAPTSTTTDSLGQAKTTVTLGSSAGTVVITASVTGTSLTKTLSVAAGTLNGPPACQSSSAQTPPAGSVLPSVTGTGICLGGGTTGAEYAIVAFYGDPDSSKIQNMFVNGRGATAVLTPNVLPGDVTLLTQQPSSAQAMFDKQLRETARRELTPLIPYARLRRQQGAALSAIPSNPTVGSLVTLNAQGLFGCTQIKQRVARIAAVSPTAIVVADTANPTGGFTDAEYASFATMFDTLINPLDVANFGQPSDIDGNGKVVIFFTKEVNALTPKGSTGGVVGGFFFERDLFPLTDNTQLGLKGCAGSNYAEMFYMLVPDPTGIYSIPESKSYVNRVTPGTLAHEYQHLINAGRRMYVNSANSFEDTWLNEGLAHIAEELLFYRVSGVSPRSNLGITRFSGDTSLVNAFNQYQIDNTVRFEIFLGKPSSTSVYGGNDSLETRGATWNLLRYLADHAGTPESNTWMALVNSTTSGQGNLARVFGEDYMTMIRNWAVSVFSDDVAGVNDARFSEQSWNYRSIFPNLSDGNTRLGKYPLQVVPIADGSPVIASVFAGGVAYLRFSVNSGAQASIDWSAATGLPVSPLMAFTVVRTK
jgi:hypothetical protein